MVLFFSIHLYIMMLLTKETVMTHENKFGLFIHWGFYALTGIQEQAFARMNMPREEYESLMYRFNPVQYDPEKWVLLAKEAGMEYICFTTKHHDGFCMWDTKYSDYKITRTPYGKDTERMDDQTENDSSEDSCWIEGPHVLRWMCAQSLNNSSTGWMTFPSSTGRLMIVMDVKSYGITAATYGNGNDNRCAKTQAPDPPWLNSAMVLSDPAWQRNLLPSCL